MEFYNLCCENRTINNCDYDVYDNAILEKNNKTWEDFEDEYGELDYSAFHEWKVAEAVDLTDEEIQKEIGNKTIEDYM